MIGGTSQHAPPTNAAYKSYAKSLIDIIKNPIKISDERAKSTVIFPFERLISWSERITPLLIAVLYHIAFSLAWMIVSQNVALCGS